MIHQLTTDLGGLVDFSDYGELLPLVRNSLIAAAVLGIVGGLMSVPVITRDLPFAVHGVSELSFAGASGALLLGGSVVVGSFVGSLLAALIIAGLHTRVRERNSVIGVLMPFGLGLGILFLSLYHGRAANKFGLLTGQIVAVDDSSLLTLVAVLGGVLVVLAVVWRPLTYAGLDPVTARINGVPVTALRVLFMLLLGATVAVAVQVVGALLVLALLCTPAAAAVRLSTSPIVVPLIAAGFGLTAALGGILLALGTAVPISPYVTTISFVLYLAARAADPVRRRARRLPAGVLTTSRAPQLTA